MKKKEKVFDSIMTGLNQALEYEKGNFPSVRRRKVTISSLPSYKAENIRSIRNALNLSQLIFAEAIGVSIKTVEAWESGRNKPRGPALRMLQLLENESNFLEEHQIICM
jgi:putative transcriptional regulator